MPHKLRKSRKSRGTRTVGYGRTGQHRAVGQRGGHGKAGRRKHLASWVLRYEPDYFKKKGFYSPQHREARMVNVGELEDLARKLSSEEQLEKEDGLSVLDLGFLGYDKLLGLGNIAKPFSVKVASYSASAGRKIEEAGGKISPKETS